MGADERVSYTAIAFDRDGLESVAADPIEVASEGYALTATARPDGVHLEWNPRRDEEFVSARASCASGLLGPTEPRQLDHGSTFVDETGNPGSRYRYVVTLERRGCDSRTSVDSPVEIRIPGE